MTSSSGRHWRTQRQTRRGNPAGFPELAVAGRQERSRTRTSAIYGGEIQDAKTENDSRRTFVRALPAAAALAPANFAVNIRRTCPAWCGERGLAAVEMPSIDPVSAYPTGGELAGRSNDVVNGLRTDGRRWRAVGPTDGASCQGIRAVSCERRLGDGSPGSGRAGSVEGSMAWPVSCQVTATAGATSTQDGGGRGWNLDRIGNMPIRRHAWNA